jgi:hypothetical protein
MREKALAFIQDHNARVAAPDAPDSLVFDFKVSE